tara:strand:- start:121 stop:396 length:276 start_codon:yes stop_codon:yes gene_type:complete
MNLEIQSFIIGVVSGFSLSVLMFMFSKRSTLKREKKIASLIFLSWIILTIAAYFSGKEISRLFDVIGFLSASNLIGLEGIDILTKIFLRRK